MVVYTHTSIGHRIISTKLCFVVPADCRTLDWFFSLWQLRARSKLSPIKLNQLFLSSLHGVTPNGHRDQKRSVETAPTPSLSALSSFLPPPPPLPLSLSLWTLAVVSVFSCAVWVWSFPVFSAPLGSPFAPVCTVSHGLPALPPASLVKVTDCLSCLQFKG